MNYKLLYTIAIITMEYQLLEKSIKTSFLL